MRPFLLKIIMMLLMSVLFIACTSTIKDAVIISDTLDCNDSCLDTINESRSALRIKDIQQLNDNCKIQGVITNIQNHEPIIGANVVIQRTSLGAVTDKNGLYNIINIPSGAYEVRISVPYYKPCIVSNIELESNQRIVLDIELARKCCPK